MENYFLISKTNTAVQRLKDILKEQPDVVIIISFIHEFHTLKIQYLKHLSSNFTIYLFKRKQTKPTNVIKAKQ